jgi:hypothetical protein
MESIVTQETTMDARELVVTQLIAQLQTYLEDLRAGRPMNRNAAVQLTEQLPELRDDECDWV